MNYKELYISLFNAVTDAIELADKQEFDKMQQTLIRAQQDCEEMYVSCDDE